MVSATKKLPEYEIRLQHNALTSWLHSLRYRDTLKILTGLSVELGRQIKILDIGCAHAKLFGVLSAHTPIDYTGIDIRQDFLNVARSRYGAHNNFRVIQGSATDLSSIESPDVVIALEAFEHIPEHDVVRIVEAVARLRPRRFICSVPIEIGPAIWFKNVGSLLCRYVRHREYTWAETFWAGLYRLDRLPPHDTGHKGFDWRWLAQTIRHSFQLEVRRFPFPFLPMGLSTSAFFVARTRASRDSSQ